LIQRFDTGAPDSAGVDHRGTLTDVDQYARPQSTAIGKALSAAITGISTPAAAASATIYVPDGFVPALSATRASGHYEVLGTALHLFTDNDTTTAKVAG